MSGGQDRRSFFAELIRSAARSAADFQDDDGGTPEPEALGFADGDDLGQATVPAAPAQRLASLDAVRLLCRELGFGARADEAVAAARVGVRLTPGGDGGSKLGGSPALPPGFTWPTWGGEELSFLGEVRLDELPAPLLEGDGRLLFFYALASRPAGLEPEDGDACRVMLVGTEVGVEPDDRSATLPEMLVALSAELTLPLDLGDGLEPEEAAVWLSVREQLAALQGVELDERSACYQSLHRLLGYPDALVDDMPLDAELVAHGVSADAGDRYVHPDLGAFERGAAGWRLLFQLSSDHDLGVSFGLGERLYVWIREDDLRAGRFDAVRAFVR